jgi:hypothetical protein
VTKRIERAWTRFERMVVPADAGPVQRAEMRKSFYAGAATLFRMLVDLSEGVSEGNEPSPNDMKLMDGLAAEIEEFGQQLDAEVLQLKLTEN